VKSPAARALAGLVLGLVVGALIVWTSSPGGLAFARVVEPVGTMWVNALRMTVIPLVASLLIATLAASRAASMYGRLGIRAFVVFIALLVGIAVLTIPIAIPLYARLQVDPAAAASLRATAAASIPNVTPPGFAAWVVGLVPSNVLGAASDGAMLPLLVFAVIFGLAIGRMDDERKAPLVGFFRGISAAMLVIVQWVLLLAPIGAFALAITVATHLGNATASVILFYIVTHSALLVLTGVVIYIVVPLITRTPIRRFAKAMLPANVVVITSRSSLAALPAMLESAERVLGIPRPIASFALPLGVSLLRAQTGLAYAVYALFLGKLYGIPLSVLEIVGIAAIGIAMSFSVPGIPSGGLLIATPYFMAVGLPPQGIGILIALDAIPDIFKTLVIVASHMSVALILARDSRGSAEGPRPEMLEANLAQNT
jgi:Na+/H+-dicarboxylate symporter